MLPYNHTDHKDIFFHCGLTADVSIDNLFHSHAIDIHHTIANCHIHVQNCLKHKKNFRFVFKLQIHIFWSKFFIFFWLDTFSLITKRKKCRCNIFRIRHFFLNHKRGKNIDSTFGHSTFFGELESAVGPKPTVMGPTSARGPSSNCNGTIQHCRAWPAKWPGRKCK